MKVKIFKKINFLKTLSLVFFWNFIACNSFNEDLLTATLESATVRNESSIQEMQSQLAAAALENEANAGKWHELSKIMQQHVDKFTNANSEFSFSREQILNSYKATMNVLDSVARQADVELISTEHHQKVNNRVLKLILRSQVIQHQYDIMKRLNDNVAISISCWFGDLGSTVFYGEKDINVQIFGDPIKLFPERKILINKMEYNGSDTTLPYNDYYSVLGGLSFRDLNSGSYKLHGTLKYQTANDVNERPFQVVFDVK